MKFSVSLAALALTATQVMAVIPVPIEGCTKSVIVSVINDTCVDFATRHGTTFDNMLLWNDKLRKDCLNLDHGHPICVSITKGDCCVNMTEPSGPSTSALPPAGSVSVSLPVASTSAPVSTASGASSAPGTSATPKPTSASASATLPPAATQTNEAAAAKGSMMIAAVGVLLSVAYML